MPRGRILAAACLAFAAGAARCAPPPKDDGCQPGPGQVALFGAPNFAPPCTLFGPGELAGTEAIVHAGKPARSLRVGPQSESLACRLNTSGRAQCSDARTDPFLPAGDQAIALLRIARWPVRAEACEPAPEELVVVSDRERRLCARLKPGNLASPAELGWGDDDNFGRPEPAAEIERRRRGGQLMHSADIGRVRTARFDDRNYGELGAMRIPAVHNLTRHYVKEMGLSLRPFVQSNPEAYYYARGTKVKIKDEAQLNALYPGLVMN